MVLIGAAGFGGASDRRRADRQSRWIELEVDPQPESRPDMATVRGPCQTV